MYTHNAGGPRYGGLVNNSNRGRSASPHSITMRSASPHSIPMRSLSPFGMPMHAGPAASHAQQHGYHRFANSQPGSHNPSPLPSPRGDVVGGARSIQISGPSTMRTIAIYPAENIPSVISQDQNFARGRTLRAPSPSHLRPPAPHLMDRSGAARPRKTAAKESNNTLDTSPLDAMFIVDIPLAPPSLGAVMTMSPQTFKYPTAPSSGQEEDGGSKQKVVEMNLRLDMDFEAAGQEGSTQRQNFVRDLKQDLADASGMGTSDFNILKVSSPGGVVVDMNVPEKAAQEIHRQSLDPTSKLRNGKITKFADKITLPSAEMNEGDPLCGNTLKKAEKSKVQRSAAPGAPDVFKTSMACQSPALVPGERSDSERTKGEPPKNGKIRKLQEDIEDFTTDITTEPYGVSKISHKTSQRSATPTPPPPPPPPPDRSPFKDIGTSPFDVSKFMPEKRQGAADPSLPPDRTPFQEQSFFPHFQTTGTSPFKDAEVTSLKVMTRVGLLLSRQAHNVVIISAIMPGSHAALHSSLQEDDKLLAVNGELTKDITLNQVDSIFDSDGPYKLNVARGDAMPFVVHLPPPYTRPNMPSNLEKSLEETQGTSWGMTLVLKEHIDLLHRLPDGLYTEQLARELAASVECLHTRFEYVGCEEAPQPLPQSASSHWIGTAQANTVLVHVNIRPPGVKDDDQRSALDVAHAIGKLVEETSSKISKGVITRKAVHVGLHLPLKKNPEMPDMMQQVKSRLSDSDEHDSDVGKSLSYLLSHIKERGISPSGNTDSGVSPPASKILSPGGNVYDINEFSQRSQTQDKDGKVANSSYNKTDDFLTALQGRMKEQEESPVKPYRETTAEARLLQAENKWLKTMQTKETTKENGASKDPTKDALLWSTLQQESKDVIQHVQQLNSAAQEAENEARMIRLENQRHLESKHSSVPSMDAAGDGVYGVGMDTSETRPHRVVSVTHVRDAMHIKQGHPNYLNERISEGDFILEVNGQDVQDLSNLALHNLFLGPFDTAVDIQLASDKTGRVYSVRLVRHSLQQIDKPRSVSFPGLDTVSGSAPQGLPHKFPRVGSSDFSLTAPPHHITPSSPPKLSPESPGEKLCTHLWGISLRSKSGNDISKPYANGYFAVKNVLEGSQASTKCGLTHKDLQPTSVHVGDILIEVEGKCVKGKTSADIRKLLLDSHSAVLCRELFDGSILKYTCFRPDPLTSKPKSSVETATYRPKSSVETSLWKSQPGVDKQHLGFVPQKLGFPLGLFGAPTGPQN